MDWPHRVAELLSLLISYVFTGLRPVSLTKTSTPGDGRLPGSPLCLCSEVSTWCPAGIQQIFDGGMNKWKGIGENDCQARQDGQDGERSIWMVEEELSDLQAHRRGCINSGNRGRPGLPMGPWGRTRQDHVPGSGHEVGKVLSEGRTILHDNWAHCSARGRGRRRKGHGGLNSESSNPRNRNAG